MSEEEYIYICGSEMEQQRSKSLYWVVHWSWCARVNAVCKSFTQDVAASLPGWFLSRCCFMLCITMEIEPRIAKQYKCHPVAVVKITRERGWRVDKKFFGWPEDREFVEKICVLGHPIARATSYCLLPDTFWLQASKNVFKVGSVKLANSLSPPSIVKKVCTGSKSSQET